MMGWIQKDPLRDVRVVGPENVFFSPNFIFPTLKAFSSETPRWIVTKFGKYIP